MCAKVFLNKLTLYSNSSVLKNKTMPEAIGTTADITANTANSAYGFERLILPVKSVTAKHSKNVTQANRRFFIKIFIQLNFKNLL